MEEGDNWGIRLTRASMETRDVKPLMMMIYNTVFRYGDNIIEKILI